MKAAIIGCGKIADAHASQILRVPGSRIVAVCDREELMAQQLQERFDIKYAFTDVEELLQVAKPDVVHITTPPQSHHQLGTICLEAGCHVYMEKPFTVNTAEAVELLSLAEKKGLKMTVGHDDQFAHVAMQMRKLVKDGYLGGKPVHMESYYCYDLADESYAKALLGDKNHWVRSLPGGLLHNIISHGICRIAEFLSGEEVEVITHGFTSSLLMKIGEEKIVDELRVIIKDSELTTAYFTFSSQMKPTLHQFRIYGNKNGLFLDNDAHTLIRLPGGSYKSYIEKFLPPMQFAKQYAGAALRNVGLFLKNDFHMKSGMKYLINDFYRSINEDTPLPISYREIILTSRIMDSIFSQLQNEKPHKISLV